MTIVRARYSAPVASSVFLLRISIIGLSSESYTQPKTRLSVSVCEAVYVYLSSIEMMIAYSLGVSVYKCMRL